MATEHIVKSFDDELEALNGIIAEMGGLVGGELQAALDALANRDADAAAAATVTDETVNRLEHEIEELAVRMIAMRQPMADDLRAIIAGLRASGDLERIGDQAKNIANRVFTIVELAPVGIEPDVIELGIMVREIVSDAVEAYVERDTDKAEAVRTRDVEVDRRYTDIFSEILTLNTENSSRATVCTHLNLVVRSIERIGDQAYGAVIVKDGQIVGQAPSRVVVNTDPTGHAEMEAIRDASHRLGRADLSGCVMYSTSPPCAMCETAAHWSGVSALRYGSDIQDGGRPRYRRC